ncbi:MAG TPA: hypothetical protein VK929_14850 [Longimicrobiales bacterium]|nr:hypothetical protein [Longimicrobiales bacterium]
MDGVFEAVVEAAGAETRYTCRGRGAPVVVVANSEPDRRRLREMVESGRRILEPEPPLQDGDGPAHGEQLGRWLLGFVEGLGLQAPHIVLSAEFGTSCDAIVAALAPTDSVVLVEARAGS